MQTVETAEIPQVQLLDNVVGRPAVVQRQALVVQTVPVPVLTVLKTVEVPQLQYIGELVAEFKVKDMGLVFCTRDFFHLSQLGFFWSSIEKSFTLLKSSLEDARSLTPRCSPHVQIVARLWLHRVIVVVYTFLAH